MVEEEDGLDDACVALHLGIDSSALPDTISLEEMLIAQGDDDFFKEELALQMAEGLEGVKAPYGSLIIWNDGEGTESILIPESMRARVLNFTHRARLDGHPRKLGMMRKLRQTY